MPGKVNILADALETHTKLECAKRPVEPFTCRLACGTKFEGPRDKLEDIMQEREEHETERCPNRFITCPYTDCGLEVRAKDLSAHRMKEHIQARGVFLFTVSNITLSKYLLII